MSILYDFEFRLFPKHFNAFKFTTFAKIFASADSKKYNHLCDIFNDRYYVAQCAKSIKKRIKFKEKDFSYKVFNFGKIAHDETKASYSVLYITLPLPHEEDFPRVWCTGYAIPFRTFPNGQGEIFNLYTIEKSSLGTTCIGAVGENGEHYNYGPAGNSEEWNATRVLRIEFGEDANFFWL